MPVKALMELAMATIFKNIKELNNAGDFLPYETLRPILLKVDSARQLRQLEINSPQIEGETGEIWLKLIEKDFPMEYRAQLFKPPDPSKWYRVYEKYKRIHDRKLQESEAKLKQALDGLREDRDNNMSKIVGQKLPPRVVKRRGGPRDNTVSSMTFNRGSRTKVLTGAGVLAKVRRETREIANIHGSLSRAVRPAAGFGASRQIKKAPAAMIEDYKRAAKPEFVPKAPAPRPAIVQQHEERASYISDSGSDGEGGFDDDEDFDDRPVKGGFTKTKPSSASPSKPSKPTGRPSAPLKSSTGLVSARRGTGLLSSGPSRNTVIRTTTSKSSQAASAPSVKPSETSSKRPRSPDPDPPRRESSATSHSRPSVQGPPKPSLKPPSRDQMERQRPGSESDMAGSAADSSPAAKPMMRKRKPVDIFMRANKKRG